MNALDIEVSKYFRRVGVDVFADLKILFTDSTPTITNETIHQESLTFKSSICDSDELEFGGCIASEFTFEVSEVLDVDLKGKEFTAWLGVVGQDEEYLGNINHTLGVFIVDDVKMVDGKDYKKVTAYDCMYIAAQTDVSEWYNNIFPKTTTTTTDENGNTVEETVYGTIALKEFKNSLLDYLGMKYYSKELPNDDMIVEKTLNVANGLTGQILLKMISVLQGGFGRISNSGYFEIINLPESESIEILDISDTNEYSEYMELTHAEYTCKPITCLKLATDEGDEGCVVGTDTSNPSNPYVISGNYFLYGKSATELATIGNNILANFQFEYRPITAKLKGFPCAQTGHKVVFNNTTNGEKVESFIFTRELSGIQSMIDNFTAKGSEYRVNEVTPNTVIEQLKSKTLRIEKSVDKVSTEISDLEKKTTSLIEQTVDEIVLKVDSDGNIVQVELGVDADDSKNYFKVNSNNITLTATDVIDLIAGGNINLTGKNITISSDNFNVTSDGSVDINSGKLYISNGNTYTKIDQSAENIMEIGELEQTLQRVEQIVKCENGVNYPDATVYTKMRMQCIDNYLYCLTSLNSDHNIYRLDTTSENNNWEIYDTIDTTRDFGTFIKSDSTNKLYYTLKNSSSGEYYRDLYEYSPETKTSTFILPFYNCEEQFIANDYLYSFDAGGALDVYNLSDKSHFTTTSFSSDKKIYQYPVYYNDKYYAVVFISDGDARYSLCQVDLSSDNMLFTEVVKICDYYDLPNSHKISFIEYNGRLHFFIYNHNTETSRMNCYLHYICNITDNSISVSNINFDISIYDYGYSDMHPGMVMVSCNSKLHIFFDESENYTDKSHYIYTDTEEYKAPEKIFYISNKNGLYAKGNFEVVSGGKIGDWNIKDNWLFGGNNAGISWAKDEYNFGVIADNLELSRDGALKIRLNSHGDNINDGSNNCIVAYVGYIWLNTGQGDILLEGNNITLRGNTYVNGSEILTKNCETINNLTQRIEELERIVNELRNS